MKMLTGTDVHARTPTFVALWLAIRNMIDQSVFRKLNDS